ncbi:hypothetical protein RN001_002817 [Aquatica leii]|uniref:Ig-like domain-containing protein n=1 Tax=Aquatica leii TaxID=1421715 RepID=A0AAN7SDJ0_9COLE|nr:hypothetical protein RN001_002817 [Aquatica leii]
MTSCLKILCVFLVLVIILHKSKACPKLCVCKWKNGKQTVECNNRNLPAMPEGIDPGTQVLEFWDNNLQLLTKENFLTMGLIHLQRIYLSRCKITNIDDRTFSGLTNLVELDLSGNLLVSVPTKAFLDCPSLMKLTLNSNPIKTVQTMAFNHLSYLNTLYLSDCEISYIANGAFDSLNSLERLYLDGNKLTAIKGSRTLPHSLRGINLQNNPWECDCHIADLHTWLMDINLSNSMSPTCQSPSRLLGRAIRSIPNSELACLPDISPTTFYLEISEGKNVSLLCNVNAAPEARVSWWFQGRVLQNDTLVAPGVHLLYYIEEGTEEKRSELFIYNTNTDDNGTFICNAENAAGTSQSNFTIRIIVKKEPLVIIVLFPFEYFPAVLGLIGVLLFLVVVIIIISIIKCKNHKKEKRDKTKEIPLQYQQSTTKCSALRENFEPFVNPLKENIEYLENQQDLTYSPRPNDDFVRTMSPIVTSSHIRSPASLRRYQLEQNPDLINDTETGVRHRDTNGDEQFDDYNDNLENVINQPVTQISCNRNGREFYTDVHLNPSCLIDSDGYPPDFGLPKVHNRTLPHNDNFYRTLPYNRSNKKHSAANPISRFSREAEFLSRTTQQPAAYEHYCPGVRYTADGYPARSTETPSGFMPSPPEEYKTDCVAPSSLPCCPPAQGLQWPHCVPANLHSINSDFPKTKSINANKRCVGAQTDNGDKETEQSEHLPSCNTTSDLDTRNDPLNEVLTESPDEGYEGEPALV